MSRPPLSPASILLVATVGLLACVGAPALAPSASPAGSRTARAVIASVLHGQDCARPYVTGARGIYRVSGCGAPRDFVCDRELAPMPGPTCAERDTAEGRGIALRRRRGPEGQSWLWPRGLDVVSVPRVRPVPRAPRPEPLAPRTDG